MAFVKVLWQSVKSLFSIITGFGKKPEALSFVSEAFAAVFLPLAGLAVGFVSAVVTGLFQSLGLFAVSIVAGLTVLVVFGGLKQFNSAAKLFSSEGRAAGTAVTVVLVLLLEFFSFYEALSTQRYPELIAMLLYLPVARALAMVSAASASSTADDASMPLSSVKGLHLVLSVVLSFVLMLPRFGLLSLLFVTLSVLAGSVTALIVNRPKNRAETIYISAMAAEIVFLVIFLLVNRPHIYY